MGTATAAPAVVKKPVKIANYLFTPHTITIAACTKVVWTNKDSTGHNVVSTSKAKFSSPTLGQGQKWAHVFKKPGTFTYHCSLHFEMTGKVVVTG
jgi:plastocyanin